jgi:tetratricopeptide (TPR) repeat protein
MYFETDPDLNREMILAFGQKLRFSFFENLPGFVEAIRLIDNEDLYPQHSSFFSRLAMTFDHGDYSVIDVIKHKDRLAEKLYRLSLNYYPNAEAYLGLGILNQKRGAQHDAIDILSHGLCHFPNDVRLSICLAVGMMNLADYDQALARFLEFPDEKDAVHFAARCYEALGDDSKAAAFMKKYKTM